MSSFNGRLRLGPRATPELDAFCRVRSRVFYPKTDVGDGGVSPPSLRAQGGEAAPDPLTVAALCAEALGGRPASVERLDGAGTFHALYRVAPVDGEALICRVGLQGAHSPAFEFLNDLWAGEALAATHVPTARVRFVDLSRERWPFDYELAVEAPGRTLKSFEDEETQATPEHLLRELGRLAAALHAVETEGFGLLDARPIAEGESRGRGLLKSWRDYILLNLEGHVRACREIGALSGGEAAKIERAFGSAAGLFNAAPSRLLHGDLGGPTVLSDGESVTALIDWEDALCGDPIFDVAYWGTFVRDPMRAPFLEGYRAACELPADFERRYWLYYLRVALSKTVHRHRFGYADRPGRPPASLRIQKGIERFFGAAG